MKDLGRQSGTIIRYVPRLVVIGLSILLVGIMVVVLLPQRTDQVFDHPYGDWSQWRGGAQRWGYQAMPGEIDSPAIVSSYRLGGAISPEQALICNHTLILAPPGKLHTNTLDGKRLWSQNYGLDSQLLGCWDLDGNGQDELIVAQGISGSKINVIDINSGDILWASPSKDGRIGAIKVVPIDNDEWPEIVWHPAASSEIMVYTFKNGAAAPTLLWQTILSDYISDPYSFSPVVIGDFSMNGRPQIIVGGGRGQKPIIVLDALSGKEIARKLIEDDSLESGGIRHLLMLSNVDADHSLELLQIGDYVSGESYMFQGIVSASYEQSLELDAIMPSSGQRMHYINGSIQDFDGDYINDILVSQYIPETRKHVTVLLNGQDLSIKSNSWLNDFFPLAIIKFEEQPLILGIRQAQIETPNPIGHLEAFQYQGSRGFQPTNWSASRSALVTLPPRVYSTPDIDNPGHVAITDGTSEVLLYKDIDQDDRFDQLLAVTILDGETIHEYEAGPGGSLEVLAANEKWIIVGLDSGEVVVLDTALRPQGQISIGGFYRNENGNGHSTDVATIADVDGNGKNEIIAVNSRAEIVRLDTGEALWRNGIFQELLILSDSNHDKYVVTLGSTDGHPSISLVAGSEGKIVWTHVFEEFEQNTQNQSIIRGYSAGYFNRDKTIDVVVSIGGDDLHQKQLHALDGLNGKQLWQSPYGTYWDATMAIGDFNHNGLDDVAYNHNATKGIVVSGEDGTLLSSGTPLNEYGDLGIVDYNGALSIVAINARQVDLLNSEDDAHMALLQFDQGADAILQKWSVSQQNVDDERFSMGAVASLSKDRLAVCVGSQRGILEARQISDGTAMWSSFLEHGTASPIVRAYNNPLSDVIALDVNGDGQMDFVVGDSTGWLYTLEGTTGDIIWSYDLGAAVGDPIAGDVDNDGFSEIVVPTADGYLYVIDKE